MAFDDVDTVTPLDGDGQNVTGLDEQFGGNTPDEEYETQGRTTVATRRGYAFAPSNKDLPVIKHTGIKVTKDEAEALVEESNGLVTIQNEED